VIVLSILVFGHKNPDTDSVAAAIALSHLKNQMGLKTIPCIIGNMNKESEFVLNQFNIPSPTQIQDVKTQVKDLYYDIIDGISPDVSILHAYKLMETYKLETLAVVDENNKLLGIISMKDIAMGLIKGNFYELNTSKSNILQDLEGTLLTGTLDEIKGKISVIAFDHRSIEGSFTNNDIIIVGDRYDIILHAIFSKVKLIIITGDKQIPKEYLSAAEANGVPMMCVPYDTYFTSKVINQCNYISNIMRSKSIIKFNNTDYLDEVKEEMGTTHFRNYPIVDDSNSFIGFINRKHIMHSGRKKVILVDHNEYAQSVVGLKEADILEIVDHHKLGDISTSMPISFRNIPVGSTCTIIFNMFRENGINIPPSIAGVLISGIISDTLLFKSPTTTSVDRNAVEELNKILNIDIEKYSMEMFKAGTSLEGQEVEEVFFKDFKEFALDNYKIGISQVFTLDIEDVFNRKDEFISYIEKIYDIRQHQLTLLLITDILKEGSYLLFKAKNQLLISKAFNIKPQQGIFVENLVSRKKQVLPQLLDAIQQLSTR